MRKPRKPKTGVLIGPRNFFRHPLVLDETTAHYMLPGTSSVIGMMISDLNSLPHAKFISMYPVLSLILIPLIVIVSIIITTYIYYNPWIYRLAFPLSLLVLVIPYCVCYHKYIHCYHMVIDYYEYQLLNHYRFVFP